MIVMKFGGTSTQDAAAIKNVVSIVSAHRHSKPVVVISAIAQATNVLEKAGKLASEGKAEEAVESLRKLIDRHIGIVDERIKDRQRRDSLLRSLSSALTELEDLVRGVTGKLAEPPGDRHKASVGRHLGGGNAYLVESCTEGLPVA